MTEDGYFIDLNLLGAISIECGDPACNDHQIFVGDAITSKELRKRMLRHEEDVPTCNNARRRRASILRAPPDALASDDRV
ncbi:hypothetical protein [Amycolatopsis sp. GM8]|uniref:hypothetical protein n=1 Tax=Amycolatopsis sp. GM8 TaxID=2896530 RepID=UPI001F41BAA2|nr:hypothetical protein [Amycolatopsis sp. GM8]